MPVLIFGFLNKRISNYLLTLNITEQSLLRIITFNMSYCLYHNISLFKKVIRSTYAPEMQ